ncbi:MAG TPA: hypothetical protein DEO84_10850 [candidate division Zixibacteria bacterium]|nr:hypothetical protein [candidate division Zixibacteria bacterium]HBZ01806.1 hypothetical protein [candidate division Zixibacteria bacterium]
MKNRGKHNKAIRICLLTLLFTATSTPMIFGSDTGWHYPQSYSVSGNSRWENPANILTCNSANAYQMGLDIEDTLSTSNYGFSLPAGAIIDSLWSRYTGNGSTDGEEVVIRIGYIAGSDRSAGSPFYLSSVARSDSAHLINFDPGIINVTCVNSTAFGLFAVTMGDEWLTDTYLDCLAIKVFYRGQISSPRRQRIIKMEDE